MKFKTLIFALCFAVAAFLAVRGAEADNSNITFHEAPTPNMQQTISLWDPENIPAETAWTDSNPRGDPEDFMPNMISVPIGQGTPVKGAVIISPGGAFVYRSPAEGIPVAEALSRLGYQCFVVNYRLRPYTQQEAALDLSRGIRYVRAHADDYGIDPDDIAVMGFSAGGILSGELVLNFEGLVNGTVLDSGYVPDELDNVPADAAAVGLMYSFYGRLSVASTDGDRLRDADLPPTYVLYGSEEVFRDQIENQVELLETIGAPVESHILDGYGHGFGARGDWFGDYDRFLTDVFDSAPDDADILSVDEPVVENGILNFEIGAGGDVSNVNVITALYENDMLSAVRINTMRGTFALEPGAEYTMKVFAWEKGTMEPVTESHAFYDLRSDDSSEGLQEMLNNVLSGAEGDIHYTYYLPKDYDESKSYPMLVTLPGWSERFYTIETTPLTENEYALKNAEAWTDTAGDIIVVSPSLTDWGDRSARQTIELTEYFINNFAVDRERIYAAGYSAGGETLSRAIDMRPELFAAYLHSASQWDGGYEAATRHRVPVYICMSEKDEYYGPEKAREAYEGLKSAYKAEGISDEEINDLLVLDLKDDSYFEGRLIGNYHGSGQLFAYDSRIINWMISRN